MVVAGFGNKPLFRTANLLALRDSSSLLWIVQICLTRWKIQENSRFVSQSYKVDGLQILRYQRLKNLVLVTAPAYFAGASLSQQLKLRIPCEKLLVTSLWFFGPPPFRFYALAGGIKRTLARCCPGPPVELPPGLPLRGYNWNCHCAGRPKR